MNKDARYELASIDKLVRGSYTPETLPEAFQKPKEVADGYKVSIDHRHVLGYVADFLRERDYAIGDFTVTKQVRFSDNIEGYFKIDSSNGEKRKVRTKVTKHFLEGYSATLEDEGSPYVCPADIKYNFEFLKKGKATVTDDGAYMFDPNSTFLSYSQKDKNGREESWLQKLIYGTKKKELQKLYDAIPEMKYAVNRKILDLAAETVLRFTTGARVIQNVGSDAWYLWLSGAATTFTIGAEKYYSKKAVDITSDLPQALYSNMIKSPKNTINRIVERRDVASWHRLQETIEGLAADAGLDEATVRERVSKLEELLGQDDNKDKVRQEVATWNLGSSENVDKVIDELDSIDYESVKKQLHGYASELGERGLLKGGVSIGDVIDSTIKGFPGRSATELRKYLSDNLRGIVREPSQEEYGKMLSEVRASLNTNIKSNMGIFMSNYPLAYLASSNLNIPIAGFIGYYLAIGAFDLTNASGFARLDTIVNLNYVLKELDKDPAISSGADVSNQLNSHLAKVESGLYLILILIAAAGQYFSGLTGGATNYIMDAAALATKYAGMKQWYKFMDSLIERCERGLVIDKSTMESQQKNKSFSPRQK